MSNGSASDFIPFSPWFSRSLGVSRVYFWMFWEENYVTRFESFCLCVFYQLDCNIASDKGVLPTVNELNCQSKKGFLLEA
jgi:hypothetical protein